MGANFNTACAHTSDKMKADTAARMQSYYDTMQKQGQDSPATPP